METVMGIDPGKNTGMAWVKGDKLLYCEQHTKRDGESVENFAYRITKPVGILSDKIAIERAVMYDKSPYRASDILDLMYLTGLIIGNLAATGHEVFVKYTPAEWKGQVPKRIHNKRVKEALGIRGAFSDHVLDAAGIAYYAITRKRL